MRAVLVLFLVAGFANSAILDSSKSPESKKTDWDDEDSMTLVSTTTTTVKPLLSSQDINTTPVSSEDQITEEQQRPRFISLIPAGTHDVNARSQSDQEGQDQIKYRIYPKPTTTTVVPEYEQDDASTGSSTTPGSSSEEEEASRDSESSEQSTTEGSRIKHIQLGKIPLSYEIVPLLPPREEKQQLLGREDTKPIGFFPPEHMMMDRANKLRREQQQQQDQQSTEEDTTEIITGKPNPDLQELPRVPLTYMVPPKMDGEMYWNQYPQPTTTINLRNLESPQTTTINPLFERINEFIQKAKRHSLEMETTTTNDNESTTREDDQNTERVETTTSGEQKENDSTEGDRENQENVSTTDPLTPVSDFPEDSNGDLNPSSPAPVPEEPTEEISTTRGPTLLYPRPNIPEVQDYSPESEPLLPYPPSSSPLPPPINSISIRPSGLDQYFSDYNNYNNYNNNPPQQQQPSYNPYYYTNSDPAEILRRRMMITSLLNNKPISTTTTTLPPPPSRPMYISQDSYWPRKYFNRGGDGSGFRNNGGYNNNGFASDYNNNNYNNYNNYNNNPYTRTRPQTPQRGGGGYNTNYDYYLRPQRQSPYAFPTTSTSIPIGVALNSILSSTSEEPSYSSTYGTDDLNDIPSLGNPYLYSRGPSENDNYYSSASYPPTQTQTSSPYVLNYRPMIPYRSSYPVTSSDLVNEMMMYAPLYSYERFRRMQPPPQPGYY